MFLGTNEIVTRVKDKQKRIRNGINQFFKWHSNNGIWDEDRGIENKFLRRYPLRARVNWFAWTLDWMTSVFLGIVLGYSSYRIDGIHVPSIRYMLKVRQMHRKE